MVFNSKMNYFKQAICLFKCTSKIRNIFSTRNTFEPKCLLLAILIGLFIPSLHAFLETRLSKSFKDPYTNIISIERIHNNETFILKNTNIQNADKGKMYFNQFFSTNEQRCMFANLEIVHSERNTTIMSNEIMIFKALMHPNQYPDWGSYLPFQRIPNMTFLGGGERFWVGHDGTRMYLFVPFESTSLYKDLERSTFDEEFIFEHLQNNFRNIWKRTLDMGEYSNSKVYTNDYGIIASFHEKQLVLWNLHDYLASPQRNDTIHPPVIYKTKSSIRNIVLRSMNFKESSTIQDIILLVDGQVQFLHWNTALESVESLPIQFRDKVLEDALLDIHGIENRNCFDLQFNLPYTQKCHCDPSKSFQFVLQGENALYFISYRRESNIVKTTLLQKLQYPLQCIGEKVIFSKTKDDNLLLLGCSNFVHMYISYNGRYIWTENSLDDTETITSISTHNFNSYYATITYKNKTWKQFQLLEFHVHPCDPRSRILRMYSASQANGLDYLEEYMEIENGQEHSREKIGLFSANPTSSTVVIVIFIIIGICIPKLKSIEQYLFSKVSIQTGIKFLSSDGVYCTLTIAMFFYVQSKISTPQAFVNQWSSHSYFVDLYLAGQRDYSKYMHFFGPCIYPAGSIWLHYAIRVITLGNIQNMQVLFCVLEIVNWWILRSIMRKSKLPLVLSFLPLISRMMHIAQFIYITHDFPTSIFIHIIYWLLLKKCWLTSVFIYGITLSTNFDFIFYLPGILFVLYSNIGGWKTIFSGAIIGFEQVLLGLSFIRVNAHAYFSQVYTLNRVSNWEETKYLKFLGSKLLHSTKFSCIHYLAICLALILMMKLLSRKIGVLHRFGLKSHGVIILFTLLSFNLVFVVFASSMNIQVQYWYQFLLFILGFISEFPIMITIHAFFINELLMMNWENHCYEAWLSFLLFLHNALSMKEILQTILFQKSSKKAPAKED